MRYIDQRIKGQYGIARFSTELGEKLVGFSHYEKKGNPFSPFDPFLLPFKIPIDAKFYLSTNISGPIFGNIKFAICIHDLVQLDRPNEFSLFKRLYFKYITKIIATRASIIFTVSEFSKQRICFHFGIAPGKIVVIGNGVASAFTHDANVKKYLLCIGNEKPYKNITNTINAFISISGEIKHDLIVVGKQEPEVKSSRIRYLNSLTDEDLAALMRGATALLFVSKYEGFGLPIIEAFSCGTPVITSNTAAMPEVSMDAARLVDPDSVSEIATAIVEHCNISLEDRQQLANNLISISKNYSWYSVAKKVTTALDLMDSVTEKKQGIRAYD